MEECLKLFVDNTSTTLSGKLRGDTYKEFKRLLAYQPEDYMFRQGNPHWDGYISTVCYSKEHCKCAVKKDGMHFPTGLISTATQWFNEKTIPFEIVDVRDDRIARSMRELNYGMTEALRTGAPFSLFDYQKDVIEKAVNAQRGIIKVATGGGKTVIACGIIAAMGVTPTIFYVTSMDLLKQAVDEIEQYVRLNGKALTVGAIGGGRKTFGDITVMTVQTAVRAVGDKYVKFDDEDENDNTDIEDIKKDIAELIHSAKLCICDEVQHWAAETCQIIADNSFACRWRYGLSATPWRDKGDDILIQACFGREIVDINASWLIKHGYLVKPHIGFVPVKNMKAEKLGSYPSVYKLAIVENQWRNELIANLATNLVEQGRTVLVLVQQIIHGETLNGLIPDSVFLHGSCTKKSREQHIASIRSGHAPVTIASTIFDEGIDCKPLNALILAGGGKSPTRALQRIGRVIRTFTYPDGLKKENAFVYDLYDHQKYVTKHALARRRIYRSEPEFDIRDIDV